MFDRDNHSVFKGYRDYERNSPNENPYSPGTSDWYQYDNSYRDAELKEKHGENASLFKSF